MKINVYNAVVIAKFSYGLETLQSTEAQERAPDVFQQRGLRKIPGIKPTYIDRTYTNEDVFTLANEITKAAEDKTESLVIPLTETIEIRKAITLFVSIFLKLKLELLFLIN